MVETRTTKWSVEKSESKGALNDLRELLLAWANDCRTKQPRYILELTEKERGNKCNCECPSCGATLTAVNAAKKDYLQRPHFRHPPGTARESCEVLTARAAALRMLTELGEILLPSRKRSSQIVGLSGKKYTAWIECAPQRIRIVSGQFKDFTSAILTLDDGRTLVVKIVGGAEIYSKDAVAATEIQIQPTIEIQLPDNSFASLSPDNLRSRLKLIATSGCWTCHWDDADLSHRAALEVEKIAREDLDFPSEDDAWVFDLPSELRRETVLHLEVKRILEKSKRIKLPDIEVEIQTDFTKDGEIYEVLTHAREWVEILQVALEKKIGHTVPDVVISLNEKQFHGEWLLIEVTVTNPIDIERLERIKAVNLPTLEISFKRAGGLVSKTELEALVVSELALKTWIHHPWWEIKRKEAISEIEQLKQALEDEEFEFIFAAEIAKQKTLEQWVNEFWVLFQKRSELKIKSGEAKNMELKTATQNLNTATRSLAYYGYPEVNELINSYHLTRLLERLYSIKLNVGVGYKYVNNAAIQVLNLVRSSSEEAKTWISLYLIATKVYNVDLQYTDWFSAWRKSVIDSIKTGSTEYLRDTRYDKLLAILFPEMSMLIKKEFGKASSRSVAVPLPKRLPIDVNIGTLKTTPKKNDKAIPSLKNYGARLADTPWHADYLQGRDFEEWAAGKPEDEVAIWRARLKAT
jgi:hypothetical protein